MLGELILYAVLASAILGLIALPFFMIAGAADEYDAALLRKHLGNHPSRDLANTFHAQPNTKTGA